MNKESFIKFLSFLKLVKVELFFLLISSFILLTSLYLLSKELSVNNDLNEEIVEEKIEKDIPEIYIDISGSVNNADVYKIEKGKRLKDLISIAGGLSDDVDKKFFNQNFNQAKVLMDQEKIYIPSVVEVLEGYKEEDSLQNQLSFQSSSSDIRININSAVKETIEELPGIGEVLAEKIINNRPYSSLEDLQTKKVISLSLFDKIKNQITLNE